MVVVALLAGVRGAARVVAFAAAGDALEVEVRGLFAGLDRPGAIALATRVAASTALALCEVVAVRIERISGKRELAQKKSDEEKRSLASFLEKRNWSGDAEAAELTKGSDN